MNSFLESREDLDWLAEVHNIPAARGSACAQLYGNDDCPERVELFYENHVDCKPVVYVFDHSENLHTIVYRRLRDG